MVNTIKTQRLEIKPFSNKDREKLQELLENERIKKTFMIPDFTNREALEHMITTMIDLSLSNDHFTRGVYSAKELIGFVNDVEIDNSCMELGYVIHPNHWNKGLATEMLTAVIQELLGNPFSVIKTGAFCENIASIRVMEKCGMQKCPQTEIVRYRGSDHACVYYEIKKKCTNS